MRIPILACIFLVVLVGINVALVSAQCQSDQQDLLLQLKDSLQYNQSLSTKLAKWDTKIDCCNWNGITCDAGGSVTGLNLSSEFITGGLENATGLFSLRSLQNLDLSSNDISTTQTARFTNLTDLTYLNLSYAGFLGQISTEISRLTNLVTLDLSYYDFLEKLNLASLVQNLTELRELHLNGVTMPAQGSEWSKALSSSLPRLEVLSLSNCFLSGPIDPSFAKLQSLRVIDLSGNYILSTSVPEFFGSFSNLTSLSLAICGLHGTFPQSVFQLPNLEIIDLAGNSFLEGYLPDSVGDSSLRTLLLNNTNFTGLLPLSIGNLKNLSWIDLANCNFIGPIPNTIENLTHLVYLNLLNNNFTGSVPSFRMAKKLTHIDLSNNSLDGEISSVHWEVLQNLVSVDLSYNSLIGSIPSSLFAIPSLHHILLSFNEFGGQFPAITNTLSSPLETLGLSSNQLEGSIPNSIFDLQSLRDLSLSFNKFNGTVKLDLFQKLDNLTFLDLSHNELTVELTSSNSSSFCQIESLSLASCNLRAFPVVDRQSNLLGLDLSNNLIDGVIPNWIWEVGNGSLLFLNLSGNLLVGLEKQPFNPSLMMLDLSHNLLQGNISLPVHSQFIDYSNNNFTSSIPPDIGNYLSTLSFFSLSNNSLTGAIPHSICNGSYLEIVDFSKNNLTGTIPSCLLKNIQNLVVLNLRGNKFDKNIPDKFPQSCGLKTLDLSGNHLHGRVPRSLTNCRMLEVFNLGNNQIEDTFPCYLKKISTLHVLTLQRNNFYGHIGCPENNATWPRLQILDLAFNNFSGNLPENTFLNWEAMKGDGKGRYDNLKVKSSDFSTTYYQDSVTLNYKGFEIELVRILTIFTTIDFSCNNFQGPIFDSIGQLRALFTLNMSHNALTGQIPPSLGNLSELESLDLSFNNLDGAIPEQLARLNFLSVFNLSYNHLVGRIPTGNQLQTFDEFSYVGNRGLCGFPLKEDCGNTSTPPFGHSTHSGSGKDINWNFLSIELGFVFGFGIVVGTLMFWKRWRRWCWKHVDPIVFRIFPGLDGRSRNHRRFNRRRNR